MCGIAGLLGTFPEDRFVSTVQKMSDVLKHRGPDDSGVWVDSKYGVGLGRHRLSVLDLSAAGHQPMHSASRRYVIVFNGEIYNHLDIKEQLADVYWKIKRKPCLGVEKPAC